MARPLSHILTLFSVSFCLFINIWRAHEANSRTIDHEQRFMCVIVKKSTVKIGRLVCHERKGNLINVLSLVQFAYWEKVRNQVQSMRNLAYSVCGS